MNGRKLHIARIAVSLISFVALTAALSGATWLWPSLGEFVAEVQIVPAIMALSLLTFLVWLVVTLIFGRVYCSSVCPMGTVMDIASRLPRLTRRMASRRPYRYRQPLYRLQYTILLLFVIAIMGGFAALATRVLDPATVYSDIIRDTAMPAAGEIGIAPACKVAACSTVSMFVSAALLVIVAALAARKGRTVCNTVCPVGTTLGLISRYAVFQVEIDTDLCIHCGKCVDACKAGCINPADSMVDGIRCVDCFDCLEVCPNKAIRYTWQRRRLSDVLMQPLDKGKEQAAPSPTAAPSASTPPTSHLNNDETVS